MVTAISKSSCFTAEFSSPQQMRRWGVQFARLLRPGDVIALIGELGAGKTTLVQGIAEGWKFRRRANSPTFALVNEYTTPQGRIFHMDMYRMSEQELGGFPLEEYLESSALSLIEWADRVQNRWPKDTLGILLTHRGPHSRQLVLQAPNAAWRERLSRLPKAPK